MLLDPAWAGTVGALGGAAVAGVVSIVTHLVQSSSARNRALMERQWAQQDAASGIAVEAQRSRETALYEAIVALGQLYALDEHNRAARFGTKPSDLVDAKRAVAAVLVHRNGLTEDASEALRSILHARADSLHALVHTALVELLETDVERFVRGLPQIQTNS